MGLRGDRFKVATCAASTAIWIATCGRPDVADVKKLQRVPSPLTIHRLVGPVVKASASRAADQGFDSRSRRNFSRLSHTNDL